MSLVAALEDIRDDLESYQVGRPDPFVERQLDSVRWIRDQLLACRSEPD